jgi:hypothetical protein
VLLASVTFGGLVACEGERAAPQPASPSPDVVAVVNGHAITREALEEFSASVASGSRGAPPKNVDARQMLLRLVDEELLLERAVEGGLHRDDRAIRDALLASVIAHATAGRGEPDEATLRGHYERNAAMFTRPERFSVDVVRVRAAGRPAAAVGEAAAAVARQLRDGSDPGAVTAAFADSSVVRLPDEPLTAAALAKLLGPGPARTVAELSPGGVSGPLGAGPDYWVVALRDHQPEQVAPFETVQEEVRRAVLRQQREEDLRNLLNTLRRQADVRILDRELVAP